MSKQQTLKSSVSFTSIGTHSGEKCTITLNPAAPNTGIVYGKVGEDDKIKASPMNTFAFMGCTSVGDQDYNIKTVEHLMSTLYSMKIDNCYIEVEGNEIPIADGSSKEFVLKLLEAGIVEQDAKRKILRIIKKVQVQEGESIASLEPCGEDDFQGLIADVEVDFPFCGKQHVKKNITPEVFVNEISFARTFAPRSLYEKMQSQGLVKGASLETGIGIEDDGTILNQGGLRDEKEFALHKLLDSIGDLYSCGYQIIGKYNATRPGHTINNALIKKLFQNSDNFNLSE